MKSLSRAAIAASVVLVAGCHLAAPNGGAAKAGLVPTSKAERYRTLTVNELCACPIAFDLSGSIGAPKVDLVVNNFKVGVASRPVINILFNPDGTVTGAFSYFGVDYDGFGPPIAAYPSGSTISGIFSGTATGFTFEMGSPPFSIFDWPPPVSNAIVEVSGIFTATGVPLRAGILFTPRSGSEFLPVTNEAVVSDFTIQSQPNGTDLSIYATDSIFVSDLDSYDTLLLESRCNSH